MTCSTPLRPIYSTMTLQLHSIGYKGSLCEGMSPECSFFTVLQIHLDSPHLYHLLPCLRIRPLAMSLVTRVIIVAKHFSLEPSKHQSLHQLRCHPRELLKAPQVTCHRTTL